jgi:hypothetical protein
MNERNAPNSALVYLAWLVPGLPLLWGVWQTLIKVAQLFQ